jgi:hypothetical protein
MDRCFGQNDKNRSKRPNGPDARPTAQRRCRYGSRRFAGITSMLGAQQTHLKQNGRGFLPIQAGNTQPHITRFSKITPLHPILHTACCARTRRSVSSTAVSRNRGLGCGVLRRDFCLSGLDVLGVVNPVMRVIASLLELHQLRMHLRPGAAKKAAIRTILVNDFMTTCLNDFC